MSSLLCRLLVYNLGRIQGGHELHFRKIWGGQGWFVRSLCPEGSATKLAFVIVGLHAFPARDGFYGASIYPLWSSKPCRTCSICRSIYTGYSSVLPLWGRSTACYVHKLSSKFLSTYNYSCFYVSSTRPSVRKLLCMIYIQILLFDSLVAPPGFGSSTLNSADPHNFPRSRTIHHTQNRVVLFKSGFSTSHV